MEVGEINPALTQHLECKKAFPSSFIVLLNAIIRNKYSVNTSKVYKQMV